MLMHFKKLKKLSRNLYSGDRGFTLIELLLVVILIGVLAGALVSVINPAGLRAKSRDSQRVADLKKLQAALELFFADNRVYPVSAEWAMVSQIIPSGLSPTYINTIPLDPTGDLVPSQAPCVSPDLNRYNYRTNAAGTAYALTAIMEVPTSNNGNECHALNIWNAPTNLGCTGTPNYQTSDVCYGVENP